MDEAGLRSRSVERLNVGGVEPLVLVLLIIISDYVLNICLLFYTLQQRRFFKWNWFSNVYRT